MIHILLCAEDAVYLSRLHGYLKEHLDLPVRISEYTDAKYLADVRRTEEKTLLVADEAYGAQVRELSFDNLLLLTAESAKETDKEEDPSVQRICRYRKASDIVNKMLSMPVFSETRLARMTREGCGTRVIGYYSPLSRCLQTSMAIATGQMLGSSHKTLYLNFDSFPLRSLSAEKGNMADLLYYFSCDPEAFPVWMERIKQRIGSLYYIPPAESFLQTEGTDAQEWLSLLRAIVGAMQPHFLLLDLKMHVAGLMEILSLCDEVYTITGGDAQDKEKLASYRQYMALGGGEEILRRTRFCRLPARPLLPKHPGMLGESALADVIRREGLLPYES
ncbi:MAG: hypothetical protein IJP92_09160 [Lachnospiraceae bacterium]|nr:hypothetical protein [Lachnospiraceae bacterium]